MYSGSQRFLRFPDSPLIRAEKGKLFSESRGMELLGLLPLGKLDAQLYGRGPAERGIMEVMV